MEQGILATVGNFDGVHLGHQYLLQFLIQAAAERSLRPLVIIPATHPRQLIEGKKERRLLTTPEERRRLIEKIGADVIFLPFDEDTRKLTSKQFLQKIRDEIGVKTFITGFDNRFGSDRNSTFADYCRFGGELGIELITGPQLPDVSSSTIRDHLRKGDVERAGDLLGRPYSLTGTVEHGQALGRTIGFPTANLDISDSSRILPASGVYAVTVAGLHDMDPHFPLKMPGATNIGYRPTVDNSERLSIETHIPGIDRPLYGTTITVSFISRLRDERKFDSLAALKARLKEDVAEAIKVFEKR